MELLCLGGDKVEKNVSVVGDLRLHLIRIKYNRNRKIIFLGKDTEHIDRLVEKVSKMSKTIILRLSYDIIYL